MRWRRENADFQPSVDTRVVPGLLKLEWQSMFLTSQRTKNHIKTKLLFFSKNKLRQLMSVSTVFGYSQTGIYWENFTKLIGGISSTESPETPSWRPGCFSFAQRWYSNQWSNREMLLLLVENYTQYPALLVWNITSWGNFWRPLLELIEMITCNIRLLVLSLGGENCNVKWPELSQTDTREKTSNSSFGCDGLLSGLSSVLNKTGLWLTLTTEQSVIPE